MHRLALRWGPHSGNPKFFSAPIQTPHPADASEKSACGHCARQSSNAPHALESYAQVFEQEKRTPLDRLEAFARKFGPASYGLTPQNAWATVELRRFGLDVPKQLTSDKREGGCETRWLPYSGPERTLPWRLVRPSCIHRHEAVGSPTTMPPRSSTEASGGIWSTWMIRPMKKKKKEKNTKKEQPH